MARQIYRQESLERLSSPEQLDMLMTVTSARGWIALLGVALLLLIGLAWTILGAVETAVEGNGLLMRYSGLSWVASQHPGTVSKTLVQESQEVKKGEPLALVSYVDENGQPAEMELRSPRSARVLDVAVIEGAEILQGAPLISVESPEAPLQAVVYIPASDGYKVHADMPVKILPATESARGAAYLSGKVRTASRFPASRAEMMFSLQNEDWVNSFLSAGPLLEVVIEVTTTKPQTHLYSGTPCRASVTIQSHRPIEFLVPGFGNQ